MRRRLVLTKGLPGQIWNVADDDPAPPQDVILYAAELLGVPPPPEEPSTPDHDRMSASFFADEKRVLNAKANAFSVSRRAIRPTGRACGRYSS